MNAVGSCPICAGLLEGKSGKPTCTGCGFVNVRLGEINPENVIEAAELREELGANKNLVVLDVRDDFEVAEQESVPGALRVELRQLPEKVQALQKSKSYVVTCQRGQARSPRAALFLRQKGFKARYLEGGMDAWG